MYLFGGFCEETRKHCSSVLRLNMRVQMKWETIYFKDPQDHLMRAFSAICKVDNNIFIFGGKTKRTDKSEEIIEVHIPSKSVKVKSLKLSYETYFITQKGIEFASQIYFFDSAKNQGVYKFDKYNQIELLEYTG